MLKTIISFCFIFTVLFTLKSKAQDDESAMMPPPPVNNKVYDAMVGEWTADTKMMGMPMSENVKVYWDLNHQFLIIDLRATSKDNPAMTYQGKGIFGVDAAGNAKTWWFDSWGASSIAVGSGAFSESKLTINDGNDMFKETRSFLVSGNEMVMNAKGTMTMNGKETPFDETSIYRK